MTGDMCEDLCVVGLVEYKRCLYYENGKKVIEARWRGSPVILKSKLENFTSYEPLGILDYQVRAGGSQEGTGGGGPSDSRRSLQQDTAEELSPLDVVFYATLEVRCTGRNQKPQVWLPFYFSVLISGTKLFGAG